MTKLRWTVWLAVGLALASVAHAQDRGRTPGGRERQDPPPKTENRRDDDRRDKAPPPPPPKNDNSKNDKAPPPPPPKADSGRDDRAPSRPESRPPDNQPSDNRHPEGPRPGGPGYGPGPGGPGHEGPGYGPGHDGPGYGPGHNGPGYGGPGYGPGGPGYPGGYRPNGPGRPGFDLDIDWNVILGVPRPEPYDSDYGYDSWRSVPYAEAVLDRVDPRDVIAFLGTTDGMVRDIPMVFRDEGVDIVRSWGGDRGQSVGRASLRGWEQFLDGRREWYLRVYDRGGRGGILRSFSVVTRGGTQSIRNVPATIRPGRTLEARLTPRWQSQYGYGSGNTDNYDGYRLLTRSMPRTAMPGQTVRIDLTLNLPRNGYSRVDVTDNLPEGWRIVRLSPASYETENRANRAVWRLHYPPQNLRMCIDAIAPSGWGYQYFTGTVRIERDPLQAIGGDRYLYLGNRPGYPGYNDYPTYPTSPYDNPPYYGRSVTPDGAGPDRSKAYAAGGEPAGGDRTAPGERAATGGRTPAAGGDGDGGVDILRD